MIAIGSGLSTTEGTRQAAVEAAMEARSGLGGLDPTLCLVFASPHHATRAEEVVDAVHDAASPPALVGCVGEAILGGSREIEAEPAVSVWMASLPSVVETFQMEFVPSAGGGAFTGWPNRGRTFLLFCDPFSFPADSLLRSLNQTVPDVVVVGGMASGGSAPGETRLFVDRRVTRSGAVGVKLPERVEVRTLVSQGCRPIGKPLAVTKAESNVVFELAGRPAIRQIEEMYRSLSPEDQALVSRGLHIGRVIDEYRAEYGTGDFLIRGVIGADPESGAIALGDTVEVGETIQFHVRDAATADEDLRKLLASVEEPQPAGALLFTCNGRGSRLFSVSDHDAALVSKELGGSPLAGFFAAGELGPVGGRNFLHGFTASMALFYEPPDDRV
jgi:small ligand-binding sensory domain FIST